MARGRYRGAMRTRKPITEPEVIHTLAVCRGDVEEAADMLGVSARTLYRRMAEFGIRRHATVATYEKSAA